jgi:hypothetical protein
VSINLFYPCTPYPHPPPKVSQLAQRPKCEPAGAGIRTEKAMESVREGDQEEDVELCGSGPGSGKGQAGPDTFETSKTGNRQAMVNRLMHDITGLGPLAGLIPISISFPFPFPSFPPSLLPSFPSLGALAFVLLSHRSFPH